MNPHLCDEEDVRESAVDLADLKLVTGQVDRGRHRDGQTPDEHHQVHGPPFRHDLTDPVLDRPPNGQEAVQGEKEQTGSERKWPKLLIKLLFI